MAAHRPSRLPRLSLLLDFVSMATRETYSLWIRTGRGQHLPCNFLCPGLWSRNSNFRLKLQPLKVLAPTPKRFGRLKTKNLCIVCTTHLPNKLSVEWEPKFQAPAPVIQNFLGSSSTALVLSKHFCILVFFH